MGLVDPGIDDTDLFTSSRIDLASNCVPEDRGADEGWRSVHLYPVEIVVGDPGRAWGVQEPSSIVPVQLDCDRVQDNRVFIDYLYVGLVTVKPCFCVGVLASEIC